MSVETHKFKFCEPIKIILKRINSSRFNYVNTLSFGEITKSIEIGGVLFLERKGYNDTVFDNGLSLKHYVYCSFQEKFKCLSLTTPILVF